MYYTNDRVPEGAEECNWHDDNDGCIIIAPWADAIAIQMAM